MHEPLFLMIVRCSVLSITFGLFLFDDGPVVAETPGDNNIWIVTTSSSRGAYISNCLVHGKCGKLEDNLSF